jgi:hypothetical protein
MRNNSFIYDPSKDIAQRGRESADLAEQALRPVIQKKVNDFNMVKDLYDNIETERQNLDQFNENLINQKIDKSLGSLSQAILKDGKLDYKKIGEMKRQVSEIRLAKAKSKIVSDEFRDKVSLLYKNADKMHDINGTISEMRKTLSDPNFLFSPVDATTKLTNIYSDGVDMNRLLQSRVKELAKDAAGDYFDKGGNRVHVKAKLIPGFQLNIDGQITKSGDDAERKALIGQLLNDQEKSVLARQLGPAMAFNNDIDSYVDDIVGGILNSSKQSEIKKTFDEIQKVKTGIEKDIVGIAKTKNDMINDNKKTSAILQNAETNAKRLGLSMKQYEQRVRDSGWSEVNGNMVYDETKDNRGKSADNFLDSYLFGEDGPNPTPKPAPKGEIKPSVTPSGQKKSIPANAWRKMSLSERQKKLSEGFKPE